MYVDSLEFEAVCMHDLVFFLRIHRTLCFTFIQKLDNRKSALERANSMSEEMKTKWREVLFTSFISSEESGEEEIDGEMEPVLYVKTLPWRAAKVNRFRKQMDEKFKKRQSKRGKRQTLPRKPGVVSTRPKPTAQFDDKFWAFA